ncbi:MAG: hypothetical protein A3H98_02140 [Bacteroidetes bacterium RIFCSPLOWO2_02_FULL_36_8]|nr:MAG: hypothetical protein A3H98_02140 [Bacteroidetes bacterium RIFCSPLOWO2_02_FULL_36_8]OFY69208.1 MAG: hypothetical protein A3G23_06575 [Bacteroidetes bacterium RIFCSPLOWO2_12_FULL_37_12]
MHKKVYILDYDLVSPLGTGKNEVLKNLKNNFNSSHKITNFNTQGLPIDYAAEISSPLESLYHHEDENILSAAGFDRKFELTLASYYLMEERLKLLMEDVDPQRAGILFGMGADTPPIEKMEALLKSDITISEEYLISFLNKINTGKGFINRIFNPFNLSSLYIASKLQLGAFQKTILTACTASTQAIALGYDSIARGETDLVITGGSDSIINLLAYISFYKLGVLASNSDEPDRACKPFDITRNGTLAGEASGICVLAGEDFIIKKKLNPLIEVMGYGNTLDAYNITAPHPEGIGMKRAFSMALKNSGIHPSAVDYINLHGTGTRSNDSVEINAIKHTFGEYAKKIPMSSTKDRHGHAIASAGIQELAILCLCMENNFVPCCINLRKPVTNGEVDLVIDANKTQNITIGITCNFSFGGVNTVIVLKNI